PGHWMYHGSLAVDPSDPNTIYAAAVGAGVYKTTDGGQHWSESTSGITHPSTMAVIVNPRESNTLYVGLNTGGGVFKSVNGGKSWSQILRGESVFALAVDPQDSNTVYATVGRGVFKSVDGGEHWVELTRQFASRNSWGLTIDPVNSN